MSYRGEYVFRCCERRRSTYRIQLAIILFKEVDSTGTSNDVSVSVAVKQLSASRQPTWLCLLILTKLVINDVLLLVNLSFLGTGIRFPSCTWE
jgi:hypothetical protein